MQKNFLVYLVEGAQLTIAAETISYHETGIGFIKSGLIGFIPNDQILFVVEESALIGMTEFAADEEPEA